jgi:transposase
MQSINHGQGQSGSGKRRKYSVAFKAQLVAACAIPGTSVLWVAQNNGIHQSVLRRWTTENKQHQTKKLIKGQEVGFVQISGQRLVLNEPSEKLELTFKRGDLQVTLSLPMEQHSQCAAMLKLVLS